MTSKRFGRLTVVSRVKNNASNQPAYLCRCDCGKETIVAGAHLRSGHTKSCDCFQRETAIETNVNSRKIFHPEIKQVWRNMTRRCGDKNSIGYHNYGGRGVVVCALWLNFDEFCQWAVSTGYRHGLEIERKDNNGNYEPDNCKWATRKEQMSNTRQNHFLEFNGQRKTITQWANYLGIKSKTISQRINGYNWSIERALTEKINLGRNVARNA